MANSSVTGAALEEGKKMAAIYGADHVYVISARGQPQCSSAGPQKEAIMIRRIMRIRWCSTAYEQFPGYEDVRETIAHSLNRRFGTKFGQRNLLMTVVAGGLNVIFKTLLNPGDEVITLPPFFGEYRSWRGQL